MMGKKRKLFISVSENTLMYRMLKLTSLMIGKATVTQCWNKPQLNLSGNFLSNFIVHRPKTCQLQKLSVLNYNFLDHTHAEWSWRVGKIYLRINKYMVLWNWVKVKFNTYNPLDNYIHRGILLRCTSTFYIS